MLNKKSNVKQLSINLSVQEVEKLEEYCQKTGKQTNDIIRELVRTLPIVVHHKL